MELKILIAYSQSIISIIFYLFLPALISIAFITFLWGVFKYFILGADDETARATGRQFVLWGLIGLAIIMSVWGLVWIVGLTLGLGFYGGGGLAPPAPTI